MASKMAVAALLITTLFCVQANAGDAAAGQEKASTCMACHGMDGNSSDPKYPKIAAQNAAYTTRHLKLVQKGEREIIDAPEMIESVNALSDQDIADIAAFYASQKVRAGNAEDEALALKGQALYRNGKAGALPSCMGCHGPSGKGNPGSAYPAIGGQHSGYTKTQLERFRAGTVFGSEENQGKAIMSQVSKNLSDAEIAALSAYLQGLHTAE